MTITLSIAALRKLEPCEEDYKDVCKTLRAYRRKGPYSAADAKAAGVTLENVVWAVSAVAINDADVERRLRLWIADCAARVLHIYEESETKNAPQKAIITARQFARNEIGAAARAAAWAAALDAARDAARDAAGAAAGAAAWAAALDAEQAWQYDRLVERLSDKEPEDWPLPERKEKAA